eukprot:CAMPEP_0117890246 /NCGR_PEP_ID=MMETSP0950-20121206/23149_1 /TAXON_ID=44440 /ORGANISM="Chattonella subsalsa, Strain CCMP2191" /LENGTH=39 /DNA_ID= /DNA_START= /DNA_END= /DNA_ORIENTATION=
MVAPVEVTYGLDPGHSGTLVAQPFASPLSFGKEQTPLSP